MLIIMAAATGVLMAAPETSPNDPVTVAAPVVVAPSSGSAAATGTGCHVPMGTVVTLELLDRVQSKLNNRGDRFGLRLVDPIKINGVVVLPAGTKGVGEVVHAARARAAGKAGELLVAARYLEAGGVQVPLRSFKLGATGKSETGAALAVGMAFGVAAYFVVGGEVDYPAGTQADARSSAEVVLPLDCPVPHAAP